MLRPLGNCGFGFPQEHSVTLLQLAAGTADSKILIILRSNHRKLKNITVVDAAIISPPITDNTKSVSLILGKLTINSDDNITAILFSIQSWKLFSQCDLNNIFKIFVNREKSSYAWKRIMKSQS